MSAVQLKQDLTPCIHSQALMAWTVLNIKQQTFSWTCNLSSFTFLLFRPIISLTHPTLSVVSDRAPVMVTHATLTAFYLFPFPASCTAIFPYRLSFSHPPRCIRFTVFECPVAGFHHNRLKKILSSSSFQIICRLFYFSYTDNTSTSAL